MINELETVALTRDLPQHGLLKDDLGAVVVVYDQWAYEVEFVALDGKTIALVTLPEDAIRAIRAVRAREIAHVREVA